MPTPEPTSQDGPIDLIIRPGTLDDAGDVAALYRSVRLATLPLIPPPVHSPEEDLDFFTGVLADG